MVIPLLALILTSLLSWYKGNANKLGLCDWSLFEWTLFTSIPISFLGLWGYWQLIEKCGVWSTSIIYSIVGLSMTITMNSIYYGFSLTKMCALVIIVSIGVITR